jgi:hypothetical protein
MAILRALFHVAGKQGEAQQSQRRRFREPLRKTGQHRSALPYSMDSKGEDATSALYHSARSVNKFLLEIICRKEIHKLRLARWTVFTLVSGLSSETEKPEAPWQSLDAQRKKSIR